MTIEHKTPKARREARSYCRRCLAVMLCCVLAFGLTVRTAPRAKAAITEAAVVGSWGSDALLGSIGFASLVGSGGYDYRQSTIIGSDITNPDITNADILYHGYEEGYQLGLDIENSLLGEAARLWLAGVKAFFRDKGGVAAGDSFEIPAEIAEAIRQWSVENLDLTDGAATYTNRGLFSADSQMVFTSFPSGYAYNQVPVGTVTVGTVVPYGGSLTISFTDADGLPWELKCYAKDDGQYYEFFKNGISLGASYTAQNSLFFHLREFGSSYFLCVGFINASKGIMQFTGEYWSRLSDLSVRYPCIAVENIADLTTTITSTNATTTPIDKDMTVTIPSDVPVANVGGISVPVMTDIAAPDLLNPAIDMPGVVPGTQTGITAGEITGAITDALPITGTIAGDQTVTQVMTEPDSLGALMITKFPFSIPWDVYKAIKLLAAPPVTPRWEVDFMEPLADNVGGFPGDTTIVIDFSEYEIVGIVTRWTSTIMFIYALASGTKRLLWTA